MNGHSAFCRCYSCDCAKRAANVELHAQKQLDTTEKRRRLKRNRNRKRRRQQSN